MRLIFILLLSINWFAFVTVFGQYTAYTFHQLGPEEGLSSGQGNTQVSEHEGSIWLSSVTGLNRFDGYRVIVDRPSINEKKGLFSPFAPSSKIYEDKRGALWFANYRGLIEYDVNQDSFIRHATPQSISKDSLVRGHDWIYLDRQRDELWYMTGMGLFKTSPLDPEKSELIVKGSFPAFNKVAKQSAGKFMIVSYSTTGSKFFLRKFVNGNLTAEAEQTISLDNGEIIRNVLVTDERVGRYFWVLTDQKLRKYDYLNNRWLAVYPNTWKGETIIGAQHLLEIVDQKQLLVGTTGKGIYIFDQTTNTYEGKIYDFVKGDTVAFTPEIASLNLLDNGLLVVSTKRDGVFYTNLGKRKFERLFGAPKLKGGTTVKSFSQANQNSPLYVLTNGGVICYNKQGRQTNFYDLPLDHREKTEPVFVFADSKERVFVGTVEFLYLLHPGKSGFEQINLTPDRGNDTIGYLGMTELSNGELLIATNLNTYLKVSADLTLSEWGKEEAVTDLFFAHSPERLLIGNGYEKLRIYRYDESQPDVLTLDTSISVKNMPIEAKYDKVNQRYYVITVSGPLQYIETINDSYRLVTDTLLPYRNLMSLEITYKDSSPSLWMGTSNGLVNYKPQRGVYNSYHYSDGLQGLEFNLFASYHAPDGTLYFGGPNGANFFKPDEIVSRISLPNPEITQLRVADDPHNLHKYTKTGLRNPRLVNKLNLPFNQSTVEISYSSLEYSDPEFCQFRTRLILNGDTSIAYSEPTNITERTLGPLAPGSYTFELLASNADGIWSEEPKQLDIVVSPPWHQTIWAYGLYALLLAVFFYSIYRYQIGQIREKESMRSSIADSRREAAESRRKAAETETSVLRLQMNPHFIFNSLNSVSTFIALKQEGNAQQYLVKFSKLIRTILNRSAQPLTRLDEAIELLEEYLATEQMRVGAEHMAFVIEEDPDLDTFSTHVPTMIVQPFIENAIWHGIQGLDRLGTITVRFGFSSNKDQLLIEVEDDGWGRPDENAKPSRKSKHKSMALPITARRMELLNQDKSTDVPQARYTFIDLKNEDGSPAGTRVEIYLPL